VPRDPPAFALPTPVVDKLPALRRASSSAGPSSWRAASSRVARARTG